MADPFDPEPVLTAEEVAKLLKVSKNTVLRLVADGMPHLRISPRIVRFERVAVLAWLAAKTPARPPPSPPPNQERPSQTQYSAPAMPSPPGRTRPQAPSPASALEAAPRPRRGSYEQRVRAARERLKGGDPWGLRPPKLSTRERLALSGGGDKLQTAVFRGQISPERAATGGKVNRKAPMHQPNLALVKKYWKLIGYTPTKRTRGSHLVADADVPLREALVLVGRLEPHLAIWKDPLDLLPEDKASAPDQRRVDFFRALLAWTEGLTPHPGPPWF